VSEKCSRCEYAVSPGKTAECSSTGGEMSQILKVLAVLLAGCAEVMA
jgi:hypothetical protein